MQYIILPPGEAPKSPTARVASGSLHDHFKAFLNVNNLNGFEDPVWDDEPDVAAIPVADKKRFKCTVREIVLMCTYTDSISIQRLKQWSKYIKKSSSGTIRHMAAYNILARAMGYEHGSELLKVSEQHDGRIPRLRTIEELHEFLALSAPAEEHPADTMTSPVANAPNPVEQPGQSPQ